jgi:crotonobetainyl-CoA:carnitine CoA-transferase CaiB-like acyl-CoA transferase
MSSAWSSPAPSSPAAAASARKSNSAPIPNVALGEHTVPVLRELGFAAEEIEAMLAAGAVGPR